MARKSWIFMGLALLFAVPGEAALVPDWALGFGDEGGGIAFQEVAAVDHDAAGNVYIAGQFQGTLNLGGATFTAPTGVYNVFVAKLTPTGQHVWSLAGGGADNDLVYDIDVTDGGAVMVVGATASPTFTAGGFSSATNGGTDAFVVQIASTGAVGWVKTWGGTSYDFAHSVAWTDHMSVVVSGTFRGTVNFGIGGNRTSAGSADFFLAEVMVWGAMANIGTVGSTGDEKWTSICMDGNDDIIFAGTFENTINFGNGPITAGGDQDACLLKIPTVGGPAAWSTGFGGSGAGNQCWFTSVATDGVNIFVTGQLRGSADLGGGNLTSAGSTDVIVAAYKSGGQHVWSDVGGSTGSDGGYAIDFYDNRLAIAGAAGGVATFQGDTVLNEGGNDALLVVYNTGGDVEFAKHGGGTEYDSAAQVSMNADGICLGGSFKSTADFDALQLATGGIYYSDAFLVHYDEQANVGIADGGPDPVTGLALGAAVPNPVRSGTAIEFRTEAPDGLRSAGVFDIRGRRVRDLAVGGIGLATGTLRWDGLDDRGLRVPAGIYFVRVADALASTRRRVVVVR